MAVDENAARLDRLERMMGDLGGKIDKLGSNGSSREVERQVSRIEEEFTADELQQVRDHRDYEKWKRYVDRYGEELEREAVLAQKSGKADDDEEDGDEEEDDGEEEKETPESSTPKKKGARKQPASRHPKPPVPEPEPEKPGFLASLMKD